MSFDPNDWSVKRKIETDPSKVAGSANLTNFPSLLANIPAVIYSNLQNGEINASPLLSDAYLKAYYRFESGALATDSSPSGHTLTAIGTPTLGTGKFGGGVSLVSASSQAYSIAHADFRPTGNFTISFWIKTSSVSQNVAQSWYGANPYGGWLVQIDGSGIIRFYSARNTGTTLGTNYQRTVGVKAVNDNAWHLITCTWDGSYLRHYIDGYLDGEVAWANAPAYGATNYTRIGCGNDTGTNYNFVNGILDDFSLFNGRALTAREILHLAQGGADFRVTTDSAGVTEIPFEVVSLDRENKTSEIWVKVPTLDFDDPTELYLWAGNAAASCYLDNATYGAQNVWNSSTYKGVWHLNELGGSRFDSSANANTLVDNNTVLSATGKIGNGADFERSNSEYLTVANNASLNPASVSLNVWVKLESSLPTSGGATLELYTILSKEAANKGYGLNITSTNFGTSGVHDEPQFFIGNGTTNYVVNSGMSLTPGTWYNIVGTFDGSNLKIYVDGVLKATTAASVSISNSTNSLFFGRYPDAANRYYDGVLDQVVYNSIALTVDEILTNYNNQSSPSTFWIIPPIELSDSISLSDSESKAIGAFNLESLTITDSADFLVVISAVFNDSIIIANEVFTKVFVATKHFFENMNITDSFTKSITKLKIDLINTSEKFTKMFSRKFYDDSSLSDNLEKTKLFSLDDNLNLSEVFNKIRIIRRNLTDTFNITDILRRVRNYPVFDTIITRDYISIFKNGLSVAWEYIYQIKNTIWHIKYKK